MAASRQKEQASIPLNWCMESQIHFPASLYDKGFSLVSPPDSVLVPKVHYPVLTGELSPKTQLMQEDFTKSLQSKPTKEC